MPAHDVSHDLCCALVGHMLHLQVPLLDEHLATEVASGANAPAAVLHRVFTRRSELLKFLEVVRRKVVVRHDHDRRIADGPERREALDRVVLQILVDRRGKNVRCHAADRYRVAIRCGSRD
ncbi:hypothetical protein D3C72_1430550 [compost metagenome]